MFKVVGAKVLKASQGERSVQPFTAES